MHPFENLPRLDRQPARSKNLAGVLRPKRHTQMQTGETTEAGPNDVYRACLETGYESHHVRITTSRCVRPLESRPAAGPRFSLHNAGNWILAGRLATIKVRYFVSEEPDHHL